DLLLASRYGDETLIVDRRDVTGVEPPVDERLFRRFFVVVVALEDVRALDQQLAVFGELDLGAGQRPADGADLVRARQVGRATGRGFGHAPGLEDRDTSRVEETQDLGVDRGGTGERHLQVAAEDRTDLAQDQLVGERVLA